MRRLLATESGWEVDALHTRAQAIRADLSRYRAVFCAWSLQDAFGVDVVRDLRMLGYRRSVVLISPVARVERAAQALRVGADAFLWEGSTVQELRWALAQTARGARHVSPQLDAEVVDALCRRDGWGSVLDLLSIRQLQILEMVTDGLPAEAIAKLLRLSRKTVEKHRLQVRRRTGCRSLAELTRLAERELRSTRTDLRIGLPA